MRDKCYGVICPGDGDCESGEEERVPVHLEIALLERRGMSSMHNWSKGYLLCRVYITR